MKKRALGRGLDVLIGADNSEEDKIIQNETENGESNNGENKEAVQTDLRVKVKNTYASDSPLDTEAIKRTGLAEVSVNDIDTNSNQARKDFDETALEELAESIRQYGIIEPIIVTKAEGRYRIIAGERRYRAARLAGLKTVPVLIRNSEEAENEIIALIENLQRADLNPVEQAFGISALMQNFNYTQEEAAEKLGKSRSQIANLLRVLSLPEEVIVYIKEGKLSLGHAKILAGLGSYELQLALAKKIVQSELNVRAAEKLARDAALSEEQRPRSEKPVYLSDLERRVEQITGTKVSIVTGKKISRIEIEFYNNDDLDRIINAIAGEFPEE